MTIDLQKILEVSTGEKLNYDTSKTWLDIFKSQVAKTPENIAAADENSEISYKKLDELSDKVAAWLIENGVEENQFVAIRIGRVKEFMAAVIGIWKVGAAYLPIDLEYPEERINYMLNNYSDHDRVTVLSEATNKMFRNAYKR